MRALEPIASQLTQTFATTRRLAPQFRALFERLGPTVTASRRGLPALDQVLGQIPPLLGAFAPFLRNADPMVRYIGQYRREITGFFANVTAASQSHDVQLPRTPNEVHYLRTSQTLTPEALAFYGRALGINRDDAYRAPGSFSDLATGLPVLNAARMQQRQPGAADIGDPVDARAARDAVRVPHDGARRGRSAVRCAGSDSRVFHGLPAAPSGPSAERQRHPLRST